MKILFVKTGMLHPENPFGAFLPNTVHYFYFPTMQILAVMASRIMTTVSFFKYYIPIFAMMITSVWWFFLRLSYQSGCFLLR